MSSMTGSCDVLHEKLRSNLGRLLLSVVNMAGLV